MKKNWGFRALALGMALCIFAGGMTFAENAGDGAATEPAQTTTIEPEGTAEAAPAREGEDVPDVNPEDESAATSENESATTSEDESAATSEDESAATSEDESATTSEDESAATSEDEFAATSEDESAATSEDESEDVHTAVSSDVDGINLLAKESETCAHTYVDEAWDLRDFVYTVKDETSHTVSYYRDTWKYCLNCGAEWDRVEATERTEEIKKHEFLDGVCMRCGCENTCPHANVFDDSGKRESEYTFKDEKSHIVSFYLDSWTQCRDCEDRWNAVIGTERIEETEAHEFINGVCVKCNCEVTCPHNTVMEMWTPKDTRYDRKDEHNHIRSYYKVTWKECMDCRDEWDRVLETERTEELQPHTYIEGVCNKCGQENTCTHANVKEKSMPLREEYIPKDADHHIYSYNRGSWQQCLDCNEAWGWVQATDRTEELQPHLFYAGKCRYCRQANTCSHDNVEELRNSEFVECTVIDENSHLHVSRGFTVKHCLVCNDVWGWVYDEECAEETEEHSFEDGVCVQCEYRCKHENASVNTQLEESYTQKDGENHVVKSILRDVYNCPTCGTSWEETSKTEVEADQAHDFKEGECKLCGYACQHPQVNKEEAFVVEYANGDADGHTKTGSNATHNVCEVCGHAWDEVGEALHDVKERHFFEDGTCVKCGYECPHTRVVTDDSWYNDAVYEEGDAEGHIVSGYRWNRYKCLDCGKNYKEKEAEITTARESHSFEDGECKECGYKKACTHENTQVWRSGWKEATWSDPTPYDHAVTGYRWVELYCRECGSWIIESDNSLSSGREDHSFDEDGCEKCGYVKACSHENSDVSESWSNLSFSEVNDEGHTRIGTRTYYYYCNDCGKEWEGIEEETVTRREPHDFVDGVCWHCGYENFCPHENVSVERTWVIFDVEEISDPTEEGHLNSGYCWERFECQDCGESWSQRASDQAPVREQHRYFKGVCNMCGYACLHPQSEVIWSRALGETSYAPVDAANHSASTEMMLRKECSICGHDYTTTEIVTETRAHTFANGVCTDCGYACAHQQVAKEDLLLIAYSEADADGHTKTASNATHNTCEVCGYAWDEVTGEAVRSVKERHFFRNEICSKCGYECLHTRIRLESAWLEDEVYGEGDAEGHVVSGYRWNGYTCLDCGKYYEEKETEVSTERVRHSFENGKCSKCGYQNACTHEGAMEWVSGWEEAKWSDPTPYDHAVTGYYWKKCFCWTRARWSGSLDGKRQSGAIPRPTTMP